MIWFFILAAVFALLMVMTFIDADKPGDDFSKAAPPVIFFVLMMVCLVGGVIAWLVS